MAMEIWVALISLFGTLAGTLGGILVSNKLTNHRIEQLEKKVDKHNNLVERMFLVEGRITEAEHNITSLKGNFNRVHPPMQGGN